MISACSIPAPQQQSHSSAVNPQKIEQHQQRLQRIFRWRLSARMAVLRQQPKQRESVYLTWRWQRDQLISQHLQFSHPLKGQLAELHIRPDSATLSYQQQTYQAASASELLQRLLQVEVPVDALSQWVLGKATARLQQQTYLPDGRLATASVAGSAGRLWQIQWFYPQTAATQPALPSQIHLQSNQLEIKLQLTDWQVEP
ncbi:lipoprotein insertase outer membrane protein LolB [Idiomarina seosinensis]|uniref:lipoprotein insertase outer membrane protein LolB n=1 Tax=Idiomarina seosinensis TaxID=281739 RepID=UPI00384AC020